MHTQAVHLKINRHGQRIDLTFHTPSVYQDWVDVSALHNEVKRLNLVLTPDVSCGDLSLFLTLFLPFWVKLSLFILSLSFFWKKSIKHACRPKRTENSYWFLMSRPSQSKVMMGGSLHLLQDASTNLKDDYKTGQKKRKQQQNKSANEDKALTEDGWMFLTRIHLNLQKKHVH